MAHTFQLLRHDAYCLKTVLLRLKSGQLIANQIVTVMTRKEILLRKWQGKNSLSLGSNPIKLIWSMIKNKISVLMILMSRIKKELCLD